MLFASFERFRYLTFVRNLIAIMSLKQCVDLKVKVDGDFF